MVSFWASKNKGHLFFARTNHSGWDSDDVCTCGRLATDGGLLLLTSAQGNVQLMASAQTLSLCSQLKQSLLAKAAAMAGAAAMEGVDSRPDRQHLTEMSAMPTLLLKDEWR